MVFVAGKIDTEKLIIARYTEHDLSIQANADNMKQKIADAYTNPTLGVTLLPSNIDLFLIPDNTVMADRIQSGHEFDLFWSDSAITGLDFSPQDWRKPRYFHLYTGHAQFPTISGKLETAHRRVHPAANLGVVTNDAGTEVFIKACGATQQFLINNNLDNPPNPLISGLYTRDTLDDVRTIIAGPEWSNTRGEE